MMVAGNNQRKKAALFGSRHSPVLNSPVATQGKLSTNQSRRCCRGLNDCMSMGSIVSTAQTQQKYNVPQPTSKLEEQVEDLEREVKKQRELRIMYRKRMERTQDYLRYCLQIAQDNGFLDLIVENKDDRPDCLLSSSINIVTANNSPQSPTTPYQNSYNIASGNNSPQLPTTPVNQHSNIASLIDQAKMNGWHIDPQEIELQEKIGQGSTAEIYRGIWRGLDVAVKCLFPDFFNSNVSGVAFFAQELQTLSRQRHRFVLQLMGACLDPPNHGWVVTEFLHITLKEWLHGPGNRRKERVIPLPPLEERVGRALEIAQAMQYLHEQKPKVIHRDLKPSNIFLDAANHIRVADFGHARFLCDDEKALTGETGTYVYMAPEVIRCEPYDEKCDVYSFGIILNELITGEYPYIETDYGPSKIALEVAEGNLKPALPQDNGELGELIVLICLSWDHDAGVRPSFSTITSSLRKIQQRLVESD